MTFGKLKGLPMTADRTGLRGSEEAVYLHHLAAVPAAFVFQHADEGAMAGIAEAPGQLGFHEALQIQVFDADGIVVADDARGQLVQPVVPPVADPGSHDRQPAAGLPAIATALPAARQPAL